MKKISPSRGWYVVSAGVAVIGAIIWCVLFIVIEFN